MTRSLIMSAEHSAKILEILNTRLVIRYLLFILPKEQVLSFAIMGRKFPSGTLWCLDTRIVLDDQIGHYASNMCDLGTDNVKFEKRLDEWVKRSDTTSFWGIWLKPQPFVAGIVYPEGVVREVEPACPILQFHHALVRSSLRQQFKTCERTAGEEPSLRKYAEARKMFSQRFDKFVLQTHFAFSKQLIGE